MTERVASDGLRLDSVIPFVGPPVGLLPGSDLGTSRFSKSLASCFVATVPRSGSWLLAEALSNTGLVGVPNEYFRPDFVRMWSAEWGLAGQTSFRSYVDAARQFTATGNGVFSAKLHWYQFAWLCQRLRDPDDAGEEQPTAEMMAAWFPNLKYVFLWRRDTARQAISYYRAAATQVWFVTGQKQQAELAGTIDFQQIRWFEDVLLEHRANWQAYFADNGIKPFGVAYEDFVTDRQDIVSAILSYLGIPASEGPASGPATLRRQSDDQSEEILAEYLARRSALAGKPDDLRWSADDKQFRSASLPGKRSSPGKIRFSGAREDGGSPWPRLALSGSAGHRTRLCPARA
jgi:trehalose 2-sulfotransferase